MRPNSKTFIPVDLKKPSGFFIPLSVGAEPKGFHLRRGLLFLGRYEMEMLCEVCLEKHELKCSKELQSRLDKAEQALKDIKEENPKPTLPYGFRVNEIVDKYFEEVANG